MRIVGLDPGTCRTCRLMRRALACAAILTSASATARGQSQTEPLGTPVLAQSIPFDVLADLPSSDNLSSLLAVLPEFIPDRLDTGGISTGESARLGAHGSTWTQTQYRIGDVDITDPDGSGTRRRQQVVDRTHAVKKTARRHDHPAFESLTYPLSGSASIRLVRSYC